MSPWSWASSRRAASARRCFGFPSSEHNVKVRVLPLLSVGWGRGSSLAGGGATCNALSASLSSLCRFFHIIRHAHTHSAQQSLLTAQTTLSNTAELHNMYMHMFAPVTLGCVTGFFRVVWEWGVVRRIQRGVAAARAQSCVLLACPSSAGRHMRCGRLG